MKNDKFLLKIAFIIQITEEFIRDSAMNPPISDGFNWSRKAFRRLLSCFYSIISFLIHKQLNGYRLPAEANSEAHLNPGSRLLGSDFLFIRVCLLTFSLGLDAKTPGLGPHFLLRLSSQGISPVKNPRGIPPFSFFSSQTF